MAQISVLAQPGLAFMQSANEARTNRLAMAAAEAEQATARSQQQLRQQAFQSLQGDAQSPANAHRAAQALAAGGDFEAARFISAEAERNANRARRLAQEESTILTNAAQSGADIEATQRRLEGIGSPLAFDAAALSETLDAYTRTTPETGFSIRSVYNKESGENVLMRVNANTGETAPLDLRAPQSGGMFSEITTPEGYTLRTGSGGANGGFSTTPPGFAPRTNAEADRRTAAAFGANFLSGSEATFFELTGRMTPAGAGAAGVMARGASALTAQLGGGVFFAEFLLGRPGEFGAAIEEAGNTLMQRLTGLSVEETAELRTATALTRARLAPLVAPQGYGIRYTDYEREAIATALGDLLDPESTASALQGNRNQVFVALAIDDARKSIAAGELPPFVTVNPNGSENMQEQRNLLDMLIDRFGFSEDRAASVVRNYNQSLTQLYRFNREDPQSFVENANRLRQAQALAEREGPGALHNDRR